MTGNRWKRHERVVAAAQGARRNPNTGEHRADIDTPAFAEEHKLRKTLPKWFTGAMRQAVGAVKEGQTPVVVLSTASQGRKVQRYAVMRFEDWMEWHGDTHVSEAE